MPDREGPYSQDEPCQLILRDHLAIDRTVLANERTLLAYIRTGLALLAAGFGFIHFFAPPSVQMVGWALWPLGVVAIVIGFVRWRSMNLLIKVAESTGEHEVPPHKPSPKPPPSP